MPLFGVRDDGTRRREKRSGSRIVHGLGDLSNLDYTEPKAKAARGEVKKKALAGGEGASASSSAAATTNQQQQQQEQYVSPSAGIFGTWDEWRSAFKTLFPTNTATQQPNTSATASASSEQQRAAALRATVQRLDAIDTKSMSGLAIIDVWRLRARNYSTTAAADNADAEGTAADADENNTNSRSNVNGHAGARNALRVPRYVEATAVLVEAQMLDRAMQKAELNKAMTAAAAASNTTAAGAALSSSSSTSAFSSSSPAVIINNTNPLAVIRPSAVANSYGGAISRALHILTGGLIRSNSFVDEDSSYRSRAQDVGVPEEAVEVRRRVAHGNMPLLSELRLTTALLLEHLYDRYWELQDSQVKKLLRVDERDAKRRAREEGVAFVLTPSTASSSKKGSNAVSNNKGGKNGKKNATFATQNTVKKAPGPKSVATKDVLALLADLSGDDSNEEEKDGEEKDAAEDDASKDQANNDEGANDDGFLSFRR